MHEADDEEEDMSEREWPGCAQGSAATHHRHA